MIFTLEILLLAYLVLSIIIQAFAHSFRATESIFVRLLFLLLTIGTVGLYIYAKPITQYLATPQSTLQQVVLSFALLANSIMLFTRHKNINFEPMYLNFLNVFSFLALATSGVVMAIIGIIGIRFIELAIAMTSEVRADVPTQLKQLWKIVVVSLILGAFALFNSLSASPASSVIASCLIIMAFVIDAGLLNLRMTKRIELANQATPLLFIRWASTSVVVSASFLFFLLQLQSNLNHQVLLGCLMVTLALQLFGFTQTRNIHQVLTRLYIVNLSFVFLLFSYCKDQQMLMVGLIYMISLHLIVPMLLVLLEAKQQFRWNSYEKLILFLLMGWLTLLPLPTSFFPRLSLMLMNGGNGNGYFYFLYLIVLIVALNTLLQRGVEYRQIEKFLPAKNNHKISAIYTMLIILIAIAGSAVGLVP